MKHVMFLVGVSSMAFSGWMIWKDHFDIATFFLLLGFMCRYEFQLLSTSSDKRGENDQPAGGNA